MQITFLTRKCPPARFDLYVLRVSSLTLDCNGVLAIKAYSFDTVRNLIVTPSGYRRVIMDYKQGKHGRNILSCVDTVLSRARVVMMMQCTNMSRARDVTMKGCSLLP